MMYGWLLSVSIDTCFFLRLNSLLVAIFHLELWNKEWDGIILQLLELLDEWSDVKDYYGGLNAYTFNMI